MPVHNVVSVGQGGKHVPDVRQVLGARWTVRTGLEFGAPVRVLVGSRVDIRAPFAGLLAIFVRDFWVFFYAGTRILIQEHSVWAGLALFRGVVPVRRLSSSGICAPLASLAHMGLLALFDTLSRDLVPERLVLIDLFARGADESSVLRGSSFWYCGTHVLALGLKYCSLPDI